MCGISGIARINGTGIISKEHWLSAAQRMHQAIAHRGYDGQGWWTSPDHDIIFAHRRLAIVDRHGASDQPMVSADGSAVLIFNGEIYNFKELAYALVSDGWQFITDSDTEVLLAGYTLYGVSFFSRLRGMYAIVIWDVAKQTLVLARDPFGIKPLYWTLVDHENQQFLLFASEVQALLASGLVKRVFDADGLFLYLNFYSVTPPTTIIQHVFSLEPGTVHEWRNGVQRVSIIWQPEMIKTQHEDSYSTATGRVRDLVVTACQRQMDSDLNVGVFLSGGLDSTLLSVVARTMLDKKIETFSLGFKEQSQHDELALAQRTARSLGTQHHEIKIGASDAHNAFETFISVLDQPSGDAFNSFLLTRHASEYVKVILSGLGSDEIFLGYRYLADIIKKNYFSALPGSQFLGKLLASSYRSSALVRSCAYRLGGQFLKYWPARKEELYHGYRSLYANNDVMTLLSPAIAAYYRAAHHTTDYARKIRTIFATEPDELNAFSKAELSWYIPGMLSRDTDAMTMAFTTEARVPFLDEELVHYVVGLPGNYKRGLRQRVNKPLLVDAFADVLPSWIINQPKKGFEMPVGSWLLQRFAPSLKRLQSCSWLNQERVRALQHGLIKNPADYQNVWSLLVLAAWKDYHGVTFASE